MGQVAMVRHGIHPKVLRNGKNTTPNKLFFSGTNAFVWWVKTSSSKTRKVDVPGSLFCSVRVVKQGRPRFHSQPLLSKKQSAYLPIPQSPDLFAITTPKGGCLVRCALTNDSNTNPVIVKHGPQLSVTGSGPDRGFGAKSFYVEHTAVWQHGSLSINHTRSICRGH